MGLNPGSISRGDCALYHLFSNGFVKRTALSSQRRIVSMGLHSQNPSAEYSGDNTMAFMKKEDLGKSARSLHLKPPAFAVDKKEIERQIQAIQRSKRTSK